MDTVNVSAVIVTRGNVDLRPVLDSLPQHWEQVVWNNTGYDDGASCSVRRDPRRHERKHGNVTVHHVGPDLGVYGRYAAIQYASHDLIYVQDDDCIVSDPQAIADAYDEMSALARVEGGEQMPTVVCNMPEPWRSSLFYREHALVGFGAAFHRDAPRWAFDRFWQKRIREKAPDALLRGLPDGSLLAVHDRVPQTARNPALWPRLLLQTCDVLFTGLVFRHLVEIPHESLDYAYGDDRMWRQPDHQATRDRALQLMREVRDAT